MLSPRCRLIGPEWIYSVFTMRTLYTLFALISLILVSFVATAAPPNPTIIVACASDGTGGCLAGAAVSFSGGGLNPHKDYVILGVGTDSLGAVVDSIGDLLTVNSDGTYSDPTGAPFLTPATWTFTIWTLDKNNNPAKELSSSAVTLVFD